MPASVRMKTLWAITQGFYAQKEGTPMMKKLNFELCNDLAISAVIDIDRHLYISGVAYIRPDSKPAIDMKERTPYAMIAFLIMKASHILRSVKIEEETVARATAIIELTEEMFSTALEIAMAESEYITQILASEYIDLRNKALAKLR